MWKFTSVYSCYGLPECWDISLSFSRGTIFVSIIQATEVNLHPPGVAVDYLTITPIGSGYTLSHQLHLIRPEWCHFGQRVTETLHLPLNESTRAQHG